MRRIAHIYRSTWDHCKPPVLKAVFLLSSFLTGLWQTDDLWHAEKPTLCCLPAWGLCLQKGTHCMQTGRCFVRVWQPYVVTPRLSLVSCSGWGGSGDVHHKGRGGAGGWRTGWEDGVCHSQSRISLRRDQVKRFLRLMKKCSLLLTLLRIYLSSHLRSKLPTLTNILQQEKKGVIFTHILLWFCMQSKKYCENKINNKWPLFFKFLWLAVCLQSAGVTDAQRM